MAGFLLGHPGDSAALAALSLRDVLAPDHVIRDAAATTIEELGRRFSPATVTEVLRPFLAGVLLDPSLESPARLFHLLWRCFLRGGPALPADGMHMPPRLLAAALPADAVRLETEVTEVTGTGVRTRAGAHIEASAVVIATDGTTAAALAPGLVPRGWHPVTTFYYRLPAS